MATITKAPVTPEPITDAALREAIGSVQRAKPNGPVLAAFLAAGIGSSVLGVFTTLAEANAGFKDLMRLNAAVGPLSGETAYAVVAFVLSWLVAVLLMRDGRYEPRPFLLATFALIGVGILGTFPLFFGLFGG